MSEIPGREKELLENELLRIIRNEWGSDPAVPDLLDAVLMGDLDNARSLLESIQIEQEKHDLILSKIKELEEWSEK